VCQNFNFASNRVRTVVRTSRAKHCLSQTIVGNDTYTTHFASLPNVSAPFVQPSYITLPECGSCVNVSTGGIDTNSGIVTFTVPTGPLKPIRRLHVHSSPGDGQSFRILGINLKRGSVAEPVSACDTSPSAVSILLAVDLSELFVVKL